MRLNEINPVLGKLCLTFYSVAEVNAWFQPASKAMMANDMSKSPSSSYEDFLNENMLKGQQTNSNSECDEKKRFESNFDKKQLRSEMNESESESESEIDLTTTGSPKDFVMVNGCIDFSSNNNNNNNSIDKNSDK